MKKIVVLCTAVFLLFSCTQQSTVTADYNVVPSPNNVSVKSDGQFTLSKSTKIVYTAGNDKLKQNAEFLAEYVKFATGMILEITDKQQTNAIEVTVGYSGENSEAYSLTVNQNNIVISGASEAGAFYGIQTLRKSIPATKGNAQVVFPSIEIKDYPRFGYRGMMLDVSRHMFPVEFVKKYIDILALHNQNRFHWHITDDQGWRIEIKKHPKLTEIGSQRNGTVIGHNTGEYDGKPYGGFFTQEEIKDVVAYAAQRYITVIPEVDMPGHMLAALTTYPNLGCTGGPYEVGKEWGVFDDVLCIGNEDVFTFLEDVFAEVVELFPSEYIHVGGDECPKVRWTTCPKCQARIKELGLKADTQHSAEDRLQSYAISRIEKFLNSKGRQIIGWDEILEGGLAPNATVMSWRGMEGGIEAAKQKHDAIIVPTSHAYFDYYQTFDTKGEPVANGGSISVEKVYSLEPVSKELTADEQKYIIGAQANLWSEYIPTTEQAEYMLLPRLAALSEVQWTMPEKKDYQKFLPRLFNLVQLYDKMGLNYAKHIFDIIASSEIDAGTATIKVSLTSLDGADIFYTLDGSEPTKDSPKYNSIIEIKTTSTLKAIIIRGEASSKVFTDSYTFTKSTAKPITLTNEPPSRYAFKGAITLVDGKLGGTSFQSGDWIGIYAKPFEAVIDLQESTEISKVKLGTLVKTSDWIFGATSYVVSTSEDGKTYKKVYEEQIPIYTKNITEVKYLEASFTAEKARYVKVFADYTKSIPDWHAGKGKPSYIFVDEVTVE